MELAPEPSAGLRHQEITLGNVIKKARPIERAFFA
jgi:hypothetical protein